jgi:hypothetical protein
MNPYGRGGIGVLTAPGGGLVGHGICDDMGDDMGDGIGDGIGAPGYPRW